jgi:hypothetical protein
MGMHYNETILYAHHIYLTLICPGISLLSQSILPTLHSVTAL